METAVANRRLDIMSRYFGHEMKGVIRYNREKGTRFTVGSENKNGDSKKQISSRPKGCPSCGAIGYLHHYDCEA